MSDILTKSLVDLIDETLAELDELKKSSRFSASEISLGEDDSKVHGAKKNGSLGKDEDKEEDDEDEEEEKDEAKKADDCAKDEDSMPEGTMAKEEDEEDEDEEEDKKEDMKKSADEFETLMKSYIDTRLSPLEAKLDGLVSLMQELADSPAPSKSVSYKTVTPLKKSDDEEVQPLSKAEVANKLFELKKTGTQVDSADIVRAELASPAELVKISSKYGLR